jgi:hypothetical protein
MTREDALQRVRAVFESSVTERQMADFVDALALLDVLRFQDPRVAVDPYVYQRAANNADAPYDFNTCKRYPHVASARILFLESELARIKSYLP